MPSRGASPGLHGLLDALQERWPALPVWVLLDGTGSGDGPALARRHPRVVVIGPSRREEIVRQLGERAGAPLAARTLFGAAGNGVGAVRNLALILSQGKRVLWLDDDVLPSARGEEALEGRLYSGTAATALHGEQALGDEVDLVDAHALVLGRRAADLSGGGAGGRDHAGGSGRLRGWVSAGARVVVTSSGLHGDPGISRPLTLLALAASAGIRDMNALVRLLDRRQVLRRAPRLTLTDLPALQTACVAVDGRAPLPPFFPRHRNTDGLWALLVVRALGLGLVGHLPHAVPHRPPPRPGFAVGDLGRAAASFRTTDLLMLGIASGPPARTLDEVARRVRRVADDPALRDSLERAWSTALADRLAGWRRDLPGLAPALDPAVAAFLAHRPLGAAEHRGASTLSRDLHAWSDALDAWPALCASARREPPEALP